MFEPMAARWLLLVLPLAHLACGAGGTVDLGEPDAGSEAGDAQALDLGLVRTATLAVGTGRDAYEALVDGQEVALVAGPQGGTRLGGFHIWSGLWEQGYDPVDALLSIQILDAGSRQKRAEQTRLVRLEPSDGAFVAYGIAPRIDDCCLAELRMLLIRAELTDQAGHSGSNERRVKAGACLTPAGARVCP